MHSTPALSIRADHRLVREPTPWSRRLWMSASLALSMCVSAPAQAYLTRSYADFEGLPSAKIRAITQGGDGLIWIATTEGLVSTDGTGFRPADSIVPSRISHLRTCHLGTVWAIPNDIESGVFQRVDETWRRHDPPTLDGIVVDVAWNATEHASCLAVLTDHAELVCWNGERWRRASGGTELHTPTSLIGFGEHILIGHHRGIHRLDLATLEITPTSVGRRIEALAHSTRSGSSIAIGPDWIGTLVETASGNTELEVVLDSDRFNTFDSTFKTVAGIDHHGGVMFGDPTVAWYYHPSLGLEKQTRASGLVTEGITSIVTDREGNVWCGTNRGVTKFVTRRFATLGRPHGLFEDEVTAVLERPDGSFVLGHGGGITLLGVRPRVVDLGLGPLEGRVLDLGETRDGDVWLAVAHAGLLRLDSDQRVTTWMGAERFGGSVQSALLDTKGTFWVAGRSFVFNDANGSFQPIRLGTSTVYPRRFLETADGGVFVTTADRGVFCVRGSEVRQWTSEDPKLRNAYSVFVHPDGEIWAGTATGLARLGETELEPIDRPNIELPVFAQVMDERGRLWMGTNRGVLRWNGERLEQFAVPHGLPGYETNRAALISDRRGRVLIGTDHGLGIYREEFDHPASVGPSITLTSLETSDGRFRLDEDAIELGSSVGRLDFHFRAIAFGDEVRVRFRTWLEGLEDSWSEPQDLPQRRVSYASVPPGIYRLHIEAITGVGQTSRVVTSPEVHVLSPVWTRTWFIVTAILASLLAAYGFSNHFAQRRYARRLEEEVERRTRDLRRMEQEHAKVQRLEALGVLAGGIAHDFNNVLTGVLGNLSLLEDDPDLDPANQRTISAAISASMRARSLTHQLLTFSKGGAPVRAEAEIGELIRDCASFVVLGAHVRCDFDLPDDLRQVDIDEGQISQVINNLMLNAMQAMPDGGLIRVRARNAADPGGGDARYVVVEFEDRGQGISPEHLPRVFDPYFSTKSEGSGLGLATAHSIVEQHGGMLDVRSVVGEGSVFSMWLPVAKPSEAIAGPAAQRPASVDVAGTRVLAMDDEPMLRDLLQSMLRTLDCECVAVGDGDDAAEAFAAAHESSPFDVVVLDLTVAGGVGGLQALQRIQAIDPDAKVIVASGYSDDPAMAEFASHGFCGRLQKPFGARDLEAAIAAAIADSVPSPEH